jgi:hypothetical protein
LQYQRHERETTVLGASVIVTQNPNECSKAVNTRNCYKNVTYRGFPFKALKTTFNSNGSAKTELCSSFGFTSGRDAGAGIIINLITITLLLMLFFLFYSYFKN